MCCVVGVRVNNVPASRRATTIFTRTMPKSTNSSRRFDRSDRDGHDGPYDEANRDGSEKKRSRHDDDDGGGVPDEFGRRRRRRDRRHPSRNDEDVANNGTAAAAVDDDNEDTSPCPTFASMNLKPDLLRGIYGHGFEKPSAIQQRAVRPIVRGRDVIAQSQSGTGKLFISCRFVFRILFAPGMGVGKIYNEERKRENNMVFYKTWGMSRIFTHACTPFVEPTAARGTVGRVCVCIFHWHFFFRKR